VIAVLPGPAGLQVPHPSTLEKITARCGPGAIAKLNEALLVKAGACVIKVGYADATSSSAFPALAGFRSRLSL
jgi:hypothetical protein